MLTTRRERHDNNDYYCGCGCCWWVPEASTTTVLVWVEASTKLVLVHYCSDCRWNCSSCHTMQWRTPVLVAVVVHESCEPRLPPILPWWDFDVEHCWDEGSARRHNHDSADCTRCSGMAGCNYCCCCSSQSFASCGPKPRLILPWWDYWPPLVVVVVVAAIVVVLLLVLLLFAHLP